MTSNEQDQMECEAFGNISSQATVNVHQTDEVMQDSISLRKQEMASKQREMKMRQMQMYKQQMLYYSMGYTYAECCDKMP